MRARSSSKGILIAFFVILTTSVFSQDLVVTNANDSIECKISKVNSDYIYFNYENEGKVESTIIPVNLVVFYEEDFYKNPEIKNEKVDGIKGYEKFRIGVSVGIGLRTAPVSSSVPTVLIDYTEKLKSGFQWGLNGSYYFMENLGVGLMYNRFRTTESIRQVFTQDSLGNYREGMVRDDITINYYGLSINSRFYNSKKTGAFTMGLSLGYMTYEDKAVFFDAFTLKGANLGMAFDLGYHFEISEGITLGIKTNLYLCSLSEMTKNDGDSEQTLKFEKEEYENLSRLDLSACLAYNF